MASAKQQRIRDQIARLEANLVAQEKADSERARKSVGRAAERAGLLRLGLSSAQLEREFRTIVERQKASDNGDEKDGLGGGY